MFSERIRRPTARLALVLSALLVLTACGRKGDPQPPPQKHPARINDLTVEQRGEELILSMSYPTMTVGGLALAGIDRLRILQFTRPAPEFIERPERLPCTGPMFQVVYCWILVENPALSTTLAEPEEADTEGDEGISGDEGDEKDESEAAETPAIPVVEPNPFLTIRVDVKEYFKRAEAIVELEGADIDSALFGGKVIVRLPLEEITTEPPLAYSFSVETYSGRLRSPMSPIVSFVPLPAPPPPTGVSLTAEPRGVRLSWRGIDDETDIEEYRILRRPPQSEVYTEVVGAVPIPRQALQPTAEEEIEEEPQDESDPSLATEETEPDLTLATEEAEPADMADDTQVQGEYEYLDRTASFGNRYVYTVTTVRMKRPLVESVAGEEQKVRYEDTFAPATPTGLVSLAESGRIRLLWDAGRERDLAGYLVFVRTAGGEPVQLTPEPIETSEYVHEGTVTGTEYEYTVQAVDQVGNSSEQSAAVTTRAP